MSNPWRNTVTYRFRNFDVIVAKAKKSDPVRYYAEVYRKDGTYFDSFGSNMVHPIIVAYEVKRKAEHHDPHQ